MATLGLDIFWKAASTSPSVQRYKFIIRVSKKLVSNGTPHLTL